MITESPIITLTTDWGTKDYFVGMVKGKLLSKIEGARIIDITHDVPQFNIPAAAFIVKQACLGFPKGTIHIIDVYSNAPFLVIAAYGQYYICSDDELPYYVFGDTFDKAVRLNVDFDNCCHTFHAHSVFCQVAQRLAYGEELEKLGEPVAQLKYAQTLDFIEAGADITAHVAYIDNYGNVNLNIRYEDFERIRAGRPFEIKFREYKSHEISQHYSSPVSHPNQYATIITTVSSTGHLQLGINKQSLSQLTGLQVNDKVMIHF